MRRFWSDAAEVGNDTAVRLQTERTAMDATQGRKLEPMLRLAAVEQLTGLKKTSIYDGVRNKTFPAPVRLAARAVAWRESDLIRWQEGRQSVTSDTGK